MCDIYLTKTSRHHRTLLAEAIGRISLALACFSFLHCVDFLLQHVEAVPTNQTRILKTLLIQSVSSFANSFAASSFLPMICTHCRTFINLDTMPYAGNRNCARIDELMIV